MGDSGGVVLGLTWAVLRNDLAGGRCLLELGVENRGAADVPVAIATEAFAHHDVEVNAALDSLGVSRCLQHGSSCGR